MELLYNPDRMPEAEIRKTFVAREALLDELISLIKDQPEGAGVQHAVIIAPRGMGKTTMLLMVKFKMADYGLAERWQVVKFPEESYGVYDLADFWIEALNLLAADTEDEGLEQRIEDLKTKFPASDDLQEAAFALLKDWRREHGKRLLLLVENFDQMLEQIDDERDNARLRDELMNNGTVMLIGSATTFFKEARAYDQPLYNFFKIYELIDLKFEQMKDLLKRRAEVDQIADFKGKLQANASHLRALEYFTGGNPRLVLMLYRVVTQSDMTEVRRGLEKLLDEVTPYYKAKIEVLPAQQRKILDHIARISSVTGEGVTPGEISQEVRLTPNQVSAQLKRLAEDGYVRAANLRGRSSYYALSEPLYAIWYQMRFGRSARRRMEWLVSFLRVWYAEEELVAEIERLESKFWEHLKANQPRRARDVLEHRRYLAEVMDNAAYRSQSMESIVRGYLDLNDTETVKEVLAEVQLEALSPKTLEALRSARCIDNQQFHDAVEKRSRPKISSEATTLLEAVNLAEVAYGESKLEDTAVHLSQVLKIKPDFHEGWYNQGLVLHALGRDEDALVSYNRALELKPDDPKTWLNRGNVFSALERNEEALDSYDRALKIKPDIHKAWHNRGFVLSALGRYEEALDSYDQALKIKPDDNETWYSQGVVLGALGRYEGAVTSYERALEVRPDDHKTWYNRGTALSALGRYEEALANFDRALEIKPEDSASWGNRGIVLGMLERYEEALANFDQALEIKPEADKAWHNRGVTLRAMGRDEEALANFDRALKIKPEDGLYQRARNQVYLQKFVNSVEQSQFDLAKQNWSEALSSRVEIADQDWREDVLNAAIDAAKTGHLKFVKQLIDDSEFGDAFFPLVRAIDYLLTGNEALIEKLSPEIRGIVEEVVAELRKASAE